MKALFGAVVLLALVPWIAFGATPKDQTPKPGPETQKLGYYVGTWKGHGETVASAFGPAGKLSSLQSCGWFAGQFQIVCRGEETGPTGKREFLNLISYDDKTKAYVQHSISSFGQTEDDAGGTFTGNKLVFVLDGDADGKPAKFRYTEVHLSPVLYTYRAEISLDNRVSWTLIGQGQIEKVK